MFTGSWSFPALYMTDRGCSKSLANKSQIKKVDPTFVLCFTPWVVYLTVTTSLVLSSVRLQNYNTLLKGGGGGGGSGALPREILKTKKAERAISGHFAEAILPSENEEFQRTMLPFIVCSFWI